MKPKPLSIRYLTVNTISVGSGRLFAQILNLITLPVALAYISPEDFGTFSLLQIAALISGVLISFGLYNAFIARFSNDKEESGNLLGRILAQQLIFGGGMLILLTLLSPQIMDMLVIDKSIYLLCLLLFGEYFSNLTLVINRWQILTDRHWQLSILTIVRSVSYFILIMIFIVLMRYGLIGLIIADFGSKFIAFFVAYLITRGHWTFEFRKSDMNVVYRLGLPAMPDPIFFWLIVFLPLYAMKANGLLALAGAFSLGWRLLSPVELLGNSLASAAAGNMVGQKTDVRNLNQWYRLSISAILVTTLGILFFSREMFGLFFDQQYFQIIPLLPIVAVGVMFLSFYYFEWISVSGSGKTYGLSLASGAGVWIMLIGLLYMKWNVNGAMVIKLFALGFGVMWAIARLFNYARSLGHWYYIIGCIMFTLAVGTVVVGYHSSWVSLIAKLIIFCGIALSLISLELFNQFNDIKAGYQTLGKFISIPNYAEIAKKIGGSSAILDVGCSEGFFLGEIETCGLKVGIDMDFERLRKGRITHPKINFVNADVSYLPFQRECFETVLLVGVLPYLDNPISCLKEVRRVLSNLGHVEISSASSHWINRYFNIYNWKHRFRFYNVKELKEFMREAGFSVNSIYSRGRFIAPLLANFYTIPNFIDRVIRKETDTVMGFWGRWTRKITNPLIQWEYDHHRGDGYQIFISGSRYD